ncbi:hypothetical protein DL769_002225 [Monosporascus sp. CRB-8-3]|nr:hypothetical protein DL769_002225 [Monosporascus sp. CRB-8-3]
MISSSLQVWPSYKASTLPTQKLSRASMVAYPQAYSRTAYNHNETIRGDGLEHGLLNDTGITELQRLANRRQHSLNGNLAAYMQRESATIRAISGRTLASRILAQFQAHLAAAQGTHKLNLMFGSFEPLLTFFALPALADDELPREEDQ